MAQRDYEEQPEAPDLRASVQLETEPSPAGAPALEDPELEAAVGDDGQAEQAMTDAARDLDAERSDAAARIDASRGSDGAVAPASGRQDAGPDVWH